MARLTFIFLSLCFFSCGVQSQTSTRLLDSMANLYSQLKDFNGSVLVAEKGKILLEKGYGYKDVVQKTKADANSLYQYGSVTKQFTAALIMYLQEKGKLNIQDKLSKYFPELSFADSVTIYHLLTHTSGIYNYTNNPDFMKSEAVKPTNKEKIFALFKNKPLEFTPGSKFSYSNSGYSLLGYIIEKASGKPYEKLMREVILQPYGMQTAGFDFTDLHSADKTTGYNFIKGEKFEAAGIVDSSVAYSAGSLYGSVKDLYAWHQALQKNQLLTPASWQQVYTPFHSKYAFGWQVDSLYGKPVAEHGGGIFGYTSMIKRFPKDDVVIVVLSNNSSPRSQELANNLAALVFQQPVEWPKKKTFVQVPEEKLKAYVGDYELMPNFVIAITLEEGTLKGQPTGQTKSDLLAEDENKFYVESADAEVSFVKDASGNVTALKLIQRGNTREAKKIK
jgi:CubicO group peptidase (beta-lactamase class C family)